jgi:hypothetical protein
LPASRMKGWRQHDWVPHGSKTAAEYPKTDRPWQSRLHPYFPPDLQPPTSDL